MKREPETYMNGLRRPFGEVDFPAADCRLFAAGSGKSQIMVDRFEQMGYNNPVSEYRFAVLSGEVAEP